MEQPKMTREEMFAAFQRHAEGEHPQDIEKTMETVHEDALYENMATGEIRRGKEAVRKYYTELFQAFPGWTFKRHAVHVTDDHIISEVTLTGVHRGPLYGIPPSGREVSYRVLVVFTLRDGKVAGEREYYDHLTLLRQMGARVQIEGEGT